MTYHGQFDPPLDQLLHERYFRDRRGGTFVEAGAADGLHLATCFFFEQELGWTGINVEPDPVLCMQLEAHRPRAVNVFGALSRRTGDLVPLVRLLRGGTPLGAVVGSVHPIHRADLDKLGGVSEAAWTSPTFAYRDIGGAMPVDLFVLDVEGHELAVIEGMVGSAYLPRVICVELSVRRALPAALEQSSTSATSPLTMPLPRRTRRTLRRARGRACSCRGRTWPRVCPTRPPPASTSWRGHPTRRRRLGGSVGSRRCCQ